MDGVILTPLKRILNQKGDIFHAMKKRDDGFDGFGCSGVMVFDGLDGFDDHGGSQIEIIIPKNTELF